VVNVKPGDEVDIYGPAIGQPAAKGVVTRIFPAGFTKVSSLGVEQQRVKVIVKMTDDDLRRLLQDRGLGVDYRVRIKIYTAQKSQALVVPRSALFRGGDGQWQVFAVRDGRAQLLNVDVGLMNDNRVEVSSKLQEGDTVILAPEMGLEEGQRVEALVQEE
jgi:HlyD family secretion protein